MRSSSLTILSLLAPAMVIFSAGAAVHYVDVNSTNPVPPYISWDTAAVTIQDAENICLVGNGDEILVTNGVYQTGGTFGSRVTISRAKYVHSINGPEVTTILGYQPPGTTNGAGSIRCVSANATTIAGFTLSTVPQPITEAEYSRGRPALRLRLRIVFSREMSPRSAEQRTVRF